MERLNKEGMHRMRLNDLRSEADMRRMATNGREQYR